MRWLVALGQHCFEVVVSERFQCVSSHKRIFRSWRGRVCVSIIWRQHSHAKALKDQGEGTTATLMMLEPSQKFSGPTATPIRRESSFHVVACKNTDRTQTNRNRSSGFREGRVRAVHKPSILKPRGRGKVHSPTRHKRSEQLARDARHTNK